MVTSAQKRYPVKVDPEANGVTGILGSLLDENFANFPDRSHIARRLRKPVAVYSVDTDESTTAVFDTFDAVVRNGIVGEPVVTVKATAEQLLPVPELQLPGGGRA